MSILTLVSDTQGDWEALYLDGSLIEEGHRIPAFQFGSAVAGHTIERFDEAESDFQEGMGKGYPHLSEYEDLTPR